MVSREEQLAEEKRIEQALTSMSGYLRSNSTQFGEEVSMNENIIRRLSSAQFNKAGDSVEANQNSGVEVDVSPDPFSDSFDLVTYIKHKNSLGASHGLSGSAVTITYEDLEIFGDRLAKKFIPTFINSIPFVPNSQAAPLGENGEKNRRLISKTSGFFKPGEMTLVLGRPGAGCSTFLREVAGVSRGLSEIRGTVQYNGVSQTELRAKYPSMVVYNPEDDAHYPSLTVRETLRFALECRIGNGSPQENKTRAEVIDERLEVILKMLGLGKCADTNVGDEIVRGCSGGERKRVSLAEQWCMGASVGVWDGSTKGLDSSTALDFIRALRVMTDLTNTAQVVSIYQASEDIYDLFDNVILIADGHVIYFGPAKAAPRDHFRALGLVPRPRSTTPDFLTGLLDPNERMIDPAKPASLRVADTALEFESLYLQSSIHKKMMSELERIKAEKCSSANADKFRATVRAEKVAQGLEGHTLEGPYFTTWSQQLSCTAKREVILAKRDIATAIVLIFDTVMSIIVGFVFFNVEADVNGYTARAGVLFFALIYMCFNCIASVPLIIRGRAISGKHKTFRLYRTELQTFTTQLTNAPPMVLLAITYALGNYWIVGLYASAASFFTFILTTFLGNQAFGAIVRLVAVIMPDLNTSMVANSCYFLVVCMSMGYVLPFGTMPTWFKIFFWINPLQYALRALFQNEFPHVPIRCEGSVLVPRYLGTQNAADLAYLNNAPENYACSLTGSQPGDIEVSGAVFIEKLYGFDKYNLYWNHLILLAYILLAYTGLILVSRYFGALPSEYSVNVWRRSEDSDEEKERQKTIHEIAAGRLVATGKSADTFNFKPVQTSFSWKHINYTVVIPKTGEHRQLLNDVQGYVKSGQMVALMGSSGAGKTTLMDCITQRKTVGDLNGQIYMRDQPQGRDFKSMTAYCEQMDVHNPFSTVRESIRFAARLRQPAHISVQDKEDYADLVLHLLELEDVADALVGRKGSRHGISLEQQKRLTIACELASKPEILFLDEPTSGLDSQAAFTIVRLLRKLTDMGQAVLCTIHQPSAVVFAHFDKVLLLARGGSTVYFGDLGNNCSTMIDYFVGRGADTCLDEENPAEWMLNVIGAGITTNEEATFKRSAMGELMTTQWWVQQWAQGDFNANQAVEIDVLRGKVADEKAVAVPGVGQFTPEFCCGLGTQMALVIHRMFRSYYRNPMYTLGRVFNFVWAGLWIGFAFFDQSNSAQGVTNKGLALFTIMTVGGLQSKLAQPNYHEMRNVFIRERASGVYDWKAFAAAMCLAELPFIFITTILFQCCFYFSIGFAGAWYRLGYFWLLFTLFVMSQVSFGHAVISIFPSVQLAAAVNPFAMAMQLLTSGVTMPKPALAKFFHWIYWINPFHYFVEGVIANEVGQTTIECDTKFGFPLVPPAGQTCGQYMEFFLKNGSVGTLADYDATDLCHYCPFAEGDDLLNHAYGNWSFDNRWRNVGLFFAFYCFNVIIIFFLVKIYKVGR